MNSTFDHNLQLITLLWIVCNQSSVVSFPYCKFTQSHKSSSCLVRVDFSVAELQMAAPLARVTGTALANSPASWPLPRLTPSKILKKDVSSFLVVGQIESIVA